MLDANLALQHTIDKDYRLPFANAEALRKGIGDRYTFRYFALVDGALWEIFGAAIQDAKLWRHQTPVRGYLLLGRRWDEPWLAQLNTIIGARITRHPVQAKLPHAGFVHDFRQTLKVLDGQPLAQLDARFNFELVEAARQAFNGRTNIERRVSELGGTLRYGPVSPDGWRVHANLPYASLMLSRSIV